jgi:hypothetical protein
VPIFATLLSAIILREATGWHRWGAVTAGFVGVLIMIQPGSGHIPAIGVAVGITSAFLIGCNSLLIREMGKTEEAATTVFYFSLISVVLLAPLLIFYGQSHSQTAWADPRGDWHHGRHGPNRAHSLAQMGPCFGRGGDGLYRFALFVACRLAGLGPSAECRHMGWRPHHCCQWPLHCMAGTSAEPKPCQGFSGMTKPILHHCAGARSLRCLWAAEEAGFELELMMWPFPPRVFAKEFKDY